MNEFRVVLPNCPQNQSNHRDVASNRAQGLNWTSLASLAVEQLAQITGAPARLELLGRPTCFELLKRLIQYSRP